MDQAVDPALVAVGDPQKTDFRQQLDHRQAGSCCVRQWLQLRLDLLLLCAEVRPLAVVVCAAVQGVRRAGNCSGAFTQLGCKPLQDALVSLQIGFAVGQCRWRGVIKVGVGDGILELRVPLIPLAVQCLTLLGRHEAQEVLFRAVADQVEVQSGLRLMRQAAKHIEVDDQLVIGALQQGVVHHPDGVRHASPEPFAHRGAVVMTEDGQQCVLVVALSIPELIERGTARIALAVMSVTLLQVFIAFATVFKPGAAQ